MKYVYNYDKDTGELIDAVEASLDPEETKLQGEDIYLLPAYATFIEPPIEKDGKIQVFKADLEKWSTRTDLRGTIYYKTNFSARIDDIGKLVPKDCTTEPPPVEDMKRPEWDGEKWIEGAIIYYDRVVTTAARVNEIITEKIMAAGEEKAKTLKMIAGDNPCPEWDTFLALREDLLNEAKLFIENNNLV